MAKDINIHVKATETDQTKRKLDDVGASAEGIGGKAKRGAEGTDQLGAAASTTEKKVSQLDKQLGAYATRIVSIGAAIALATKAIQANSQALEENARIAGEQQKSLLTLQFLGELFKERPELRKEVIALSEFGVRPFEEVAQAWYNLRSKGAGLTQQQKDAILREALEMGRTAPETPVDTLIDMFALYAKKTRDIDMNLVQNVLQQTITEAGGTAADVAKYMPMFLPLGMAGGMTGPQAAGLWAYATTLTSEASRATTGLQALFMGLQGKGTPESQKILEQMGITPGMGFFEKMGLLGQEFAGGRFGLAQAEQLAGREGASLLLDFIRNPQALMAQIAKVTGAARGDIDITRTMITELMGADELARLEEQSRRLDIQIQNIRGGDVKGLKLKTMAQEYEKAMRREKVPEYLIKSNLWWLRMLGGFGVEPETLIEHPWLVEPRGLFKRDIPSIFEEAINPNQTTIINNNYGDTFVPRVAPAEPLRAAPAAVE